MCDIVDIKCSYPGCNCTCQIHIKNFCVPSSEIEGRCSKHMPNKGVWQYFYNMDDLPRSFYLRLLCDAPIGYEVSGKGGICPNSGFKESKYTVLDIT